jgi:hypothetical protein
MTWTTGSITASGTGEGLLEPGCRFTLFHGSAGCLMMGWVIISTLKHAGAMGREQRSGKVSTGTTTSSRAWLVAASPVNAMSINGGSHGLNRPAD